MKPAFNRIEPDLPPSDQVKTPPPVGRKRTFSFEIRRASPPISVPPEIQNQAYNPDLVADLLQFNQQGESSDRQTTSPAVETHQTPATPLDVATCEAQLQRIVRQIEQLYFEGPIVAGWLESFSTATDVMHQDSAAEPSPSQVDVSSLHPEPIVTPHANYHLCGLDPAGQKWCYPCPVEQLPSVSIAIARYQKLQQFLEHKQYFETCLSTIKP